jgi:hypothetical protein
MKLSAHRAALPPRGRSHQPVTILKGIVLFAALPLDVRKGCAFPPPSLLTFFCGLCPLHSFPPSGSVLYSIVSLLQPSLP